jgi:hypothetical protein
VSAEPPSLIYRTLLSPPHWSRMLPPPPGWSTISTCTPCCAPDCGVTTFVVLVVLGMPGALLAVPVAEIIRIVVINLVAYRRTRRGTSEPEVSSPSEPTT